MRSIKASIRRKLWLLFIAAGLAWLLTPGFSLAKPKEPADEEISSAVESQFWSDDVVNPNEIDVTTHSGIVKLSGKVDNILAKDRATQIAGTIVGVRGVINQIEVDPRLTISSAELRKGVKKALLQDPATDSYEVRVEAVVDGVVTLTGNVDSWQEKQLCTIVAKGVKGVREVKNEIDFAYKEDRPDREIQAEVEARLANDVRVDDNAIEVRVQDGRVYLSGVVESLAEKNRAQADGWVGGVESVDVENLSVEWWARDRMRRKTSFIMCTDEEIKQAVKAAFLYDPRVNSVQPEVKVNSGVVTLSGVVEDLEAKRSAEADARNTIGVFRVINHLKVRPESIPSNVALEKRVSNALSNDFYLEGNDITINAANGLVYLTGDVNNSFEKEHARRVAEGVKGVTDVINNIDYEHRWTWRPDWEIREEVKDQLSWSSFVDEDQISVTVEEGVVTLTGRVDTWGEKQAAENNAWEGGAKDVRNQLMVAYTTHGPNADSWPLYPYLIP
jgi:osmotically-inducible protein OsmY